MIVDLIFQVEENKLIASSTYEMTLKTEKLPPIKAGQFAEVKIPSREDLILRRPFCVYSVDSEKNSIKIGYALRGKGTKELSALKVGDEVQVLLPLGNGFPSVEKGKKILLAGGGVGVLPLLSVAESYLDNEVYCCLGFKDKNLVMKADEFKKLCKKAVFATDDGSFGEKGFVAEVLERHIDDVKPDVIFACGPEPMLKSLKKFSAVPTYVSLEQRMGCGIGACLVCACKIKKADGEHHLRVCKDGPVFLFDEVFYG